MLNPVWFRLVRVRYYKDVEADGTKYGGNDRAKMQDTSSYYNVATTDLLTAEMVSDDVLAKYYYNPNSYYNPTSYQYYYEALGFQLTRGISAYGPDKKDVDTVDPPTLMA